MWKFPVLVLFGGLALAGLGQSAVCAEVLITPEEAKLPPSANVSLTTRGLTRGPGIEQESPGPNQHVLSPLPLRIKFQARNQVAIDPASVKVTYLKVNPIDLTERLKTHITADGIDMSNAEVPPGVHMMRVDLKDVQGRAGTVVVKLTVSDK